MRVLTRVPVILELECGSERSFHRGVVRSQQACVESSGVRAPEWRFGFPIPDAFQHSLVVVAFSAVATEGELAGRPREDNRERRPQKSVDARSHTQAVPRCQRERLRRSSPRAVRFPDRSRLSSRLSTKPDHDLRSVFRPLSPQTSSSRRMMSMTRNGSR